MGTTPYLGVGHLPISNCACLEAGTAESTGGELTGGLFTHESQGRK